MAAQAAANQQKQFDDINRAVMMQRLQAARPQGPPMGMVSDFLNVCFFDYRLIMFLFVLQMPVVSSQMQLPQMMRPGMQFSPQSALMGGNMIRPPGMGMPPTGMEGL